jgi:HEAT repeat protein
VIIRAAGKSKSRALHDILAQRLMDPAAGAYAYELIDALSETGTADYAATIVPFLESPDDGAVRTTAAYALGMLQSPVAIRPLVKQYQKSRDKRMKHLCLQSLRRIFGGRANAASLEIYLTDAPKKTREEILAAILNAA